MTRVRSPRARCRRRLESNRRRQLGQATVAAKESPTCRWPQRLERSQVSELLIHVTLIVIAPFAEIILLGSCRAPCCFKRSMIVVV